jgi:hypothetical protein
LIQIIPVSIKIMTISIQKAAISKKPIREGQNYDGHFVKNRSRWNV